MSIQTNADNLRDLIRNLGGEPRGRTIAELLDQIETLAPEGGGGGGGGAASDAALSDEDMDYVFRDGE